METKTLCWFTMMAFLVVNLVFIGSCCSWDQKSIRVLVVSDDYDKNITENFRKLTSEESLNALYNKPGTCVKFNFLTFKTGSSSEINIINETYRQVSQYSFCVIILASKHRYSWYVLEHAKTKQIPVINILSEKSSQYSHVVWKGLPMIHLNLRASIQDKAASIPPILKTLHWKKIILIHDNSMENMQIAASFGRTFPLNNILMLNTTMVTNETSIEKLYEKINDLKKYGSSFLIITDRAATINSIFKVADILGMLQPAFMWIIFSKLTSNFVPSYMIPFELLIVSPSEFKCESRDLIRDSLSLVFKGFSIASKVKGKQKCSSLCDCELFTSQLFRSFQQAEFQGATGLVKFDDTGIRRYSQSDIRVVTEIEGEIKQEFIGKWNGKTVKINEQKSRPRLRALINEYPPNIMAMPKLKGKQCPSSANICNKNVMSPDGKKIPKEYCCYGFAIDVLNLIKEDIGIEADLHFSEDGQYGVLTDNNTWNGIVSELLEDKGDIALDLYVSARRSKVLDFTEPYAPSGIRLLVKEHSGKSSNIYWLSYLRPFTSNLWLTLLGSVGIMIVFLWIVEKFAPRRYPPKTLEDIILEAKVNEEEIYQEIILEKQRDGYDYYGHLPENILENDKGDFEQQFSPIMYGSFGLDNAVCYTLALAVGRPADVAKPLLNGARLASVAFGVAMLMVVSSYSANLAAFLIVDDKYTSVTTIYDEKIAHPPPGFRYGTVKGSYMADFFSNTENAYMRSMWYHMKKNNVDTVTDGVQKVKNGDLDVLIADHISLEYESLNDPSCRLKVVGEPFAMSGAAIAAKKGSPWFAKFKAVLQQLKSKGLTDFIQKFWVSKYKCVNEKPPSQLKIQDLSGLFLQLAIAVMACSVGTFLHNVVSFLAHSYRTQKSRANSIITNTNTIENDRDRRKLRFKPIKSVETDV